eukprot:Rhum_TRINITY_DN25972_c0_g1::Rhum_TRINITY_DN25972_c0_g1_i1::g.183036::m.183036
MGGVDAAAKYASRLRSFRKGLNHCMSGNGRCVVVCGEGMALEAGVARARGWHIGEAYYEPGAMRTRVAWKRMWWEVWAWYARRAGESLAAEPASCHAATTDLLSLLGLRCTALVLSTDGLLRRAAADAVDAGNTLYNQQLIELNGNVTTMTCDHADAPHATEEFPLPVLETVDDWRVFRSGKRRLNQTEVSQLRCPLCMSKARPNERFTDDDDAQRAASAHLKTLVDNCSLLVVLGCEEQSPLVAQLIDTTRANGGWIVRAGSRVHHTSPADPEGATGMTGIRAGDSPLVGSTTRFLEMGSAEQPVMLAR